MIYKYRFRNSEVNPIDQLVFKKQYVLYTLFHSCQRQWQQVTNGENSHVEEICWL